MKVSSNAIAVIALIKPFSAATSDNLWTIALEDSSLTADFSSESTDQVKMEYQIGRGREDVKHFLYAKQCEIKESITGLTPATTATTPLRISRGGSSDCTDVNGNYYRQVVVIISDAFPYPITRDGCFQFCAILPNQEDQVGLWMGDNTGVHGSPDYCTCFYDHSLPVNIPSYAVKSNQSLGTGPMKPLPFVPKYNKIDCYAFDGVNTGMDTLDIRHTFNKALIEGSNIWNATTSAINLCQVVQLTGPSYDGQEIIITEDQRTVIIDFDLGADYSTGSVNLDAATILVNTKETNLADYVVAYKCDDKFAKSYASLGPNDELKVCITTSSSEVQMEKIVTMVINQGNMTSFPVIEEDSVIFSGLTVVKYANNSTGFVAMVATRVPRNLFDFEAESARIEVTGAVYLKFGDTQVIPGGSSRMLQADVDADLVNANVEEAAFNLIVGLQSEKTHQLEEAMMNSAKSFADKRSVIIVILFASFYALW